MACNSTYCIRNTGNITYDDYYISGGTHNSNLYWVGQSNGLFIYYSTEDTQWCLSSNLDGFCLLSGKSPCASECPDLSYAYFSSGMCLTPTPSPTNNCNSLDFVALLECDIIPSPSPTQTKTPTPTPTVTPSLNLCLTINIDATIESTSPTPTPTLTPTPTSSSIIERNCSFASPITYNIIDDNIICPQSYLFKNCYNNEIYSTTNLTSSIGNISLTKYQVYLAMVDNVRKCISYYEKSDTTLGGYDIELISEPFGLISQNGCDYCNQELTIP
jgi:hypothetical protein